MEFNLPEEIRQEHALMLGLTLRELLFVLIGCFWSFFFYSVYKENFDYLILLPPIGVTFFGGFFYKVNTYHLQLENYIKDILIPFYLSPKKRRYSIDNNYIESIKKIKQKNKTELENAKTKKEKKKEKKANKKALKALKKKKRKSPYKAML